MSHFDLKEAAGKIEEEMMLRDKEEKTKKPAVTLPNWSQLFIFVKRKKKQFHKVLTKP